MNSSGVSGSSFSKGNFVQAYGLIRDNLDLKNRYVVLLGFFASRSVDKKENESMLKNLKDFGQMLSNVQIKQEFHNPLEEIRNFSEASKLNDVNKALPALKKIISSVQAVFRAAENVEKSLEEASNDSSQGGGEAEAALAALLNRMSTNVQPLDESHLHRQPDPCVSGFIRIYTVSKNFQSLDYDGNPRLNDKMPTLHRFLVNLISYFSGNKSIHEAIFILAPLKKFFEENLEMLNKYAINDPNEFIEKLKNKDGLPSELFLKSIKESVESDFEYNNRNTQDLKEWFDSKANDLINQDPAFKIMHERRDKRVVEHSVHAFGRHLNHGSGAQVSGQATPGTWGDVFGSAPIEGGEPLIDVGRFNIEIDETFSGLPENVRKKILSHREQRFNDYKNNGKLVSTYLSGTRTVGKEAGSIGEVPIQDPEMRIQCTIDMLFFRAIREHKNSSGILFVEPSEEDKTAIQNKVFEDFAIDCFSRELLPTLGLYLYMLQCLRYLSDSLDTANMKIEDLINLIANEKVKDAANKFYRKKFSENNSNPESKEN